MANEKGTGQPSHKSSEEPLEHHEGPTPHGKSGSEHSDKSSSRSSSKHSGSGEAKSSESGSSRSGGDESGSRSSDSKEEDLKSREYRDKDGDIHHHTHTAAAMQDRGKREGEKE